MKIKGILVFIAMIICLISVVAVSTAAEEQTPVYTVTTAEGEDTHYYSPDGFRGVVMAAPNGATVTLHKSVEVAGGITVGGTEEEPRTLNIDLAGNGIYSLAKITMFQISNYGTLNLYSSAPDAFLYITSVANPGQGGCIFSVIGQDALVNMGSAVKSLDTVYSGDNISTFSSCFVDIRGEGTIGFNLEGGKHFANIADWMGFINPRSGDGNITIKNADILVIENNNLIHSESPYTSLYMENCTIVRIDGNSSNLFNSIHASIVFKDCISNYSLTYNLSGGTYVPGCVKLEGNNVFSSRLGFVEELVAGDEKYVPARTVVDYELVSGGDTFWYFDDTGKLSRYNDTIPPLNESYMIIRESDAVTYTWEYGKEEIVEVWSKTETPVPPRSLKFDSIEGLYKYGWLRDRSDLDTVRYVGGPVVDFDIKVSCVYEDYLYYNIYVPAYVFEEGYISFVNGRIDGAAFRDSEWTAVTVDGTDYYRYSTVFLEEDEALRDIEIYLPLDINDGSTFVEAKGKWVISLESYIEAANANKESYTADEMSVVDALYNDFILTADGSQTPEETACLPITKQERY